MKIYKFDRRDFLIYYESEQIYKLELEANLLLPCPKVKRSKELESVMFDNSQNLQSTTTTFSYNLMAGGKAKCHLFFALSLIKLIFIW